MPSIPKATFQIVRCMIETRTVQLSLVGLWRGREEWFWQTALILLETPLLGMKGRKKDDVLLLSPEPILLLSPPLPFPPFLLQTRLQCEYAPGTVLGTIQFESDIVAGPEEDLSLVGSKQ